MLNKFVLCWCLAFTVLAATVPSLYCQQKVANKKERPTKFNKPVLIEFKGEINRKLFRYFVNRFEKAKRRGADLVIVEIDSPGGYLTESVEIANMLKSCDWAHTVAYIPQSAYSGAALVSFGCDETIISENAHLGDIGVVAMDPTLMAFRYADAKARTVFVGRARTISAAKGRSPDLVEAMIDKNVAVYSRESNGKHEFKKKNIIEGQDLPQKEGPWQLIDESGINRFLLLDGQRAIEFGMADHFATDRDAALANLGVTDRVKIESYKTADAVAYWLNNPFVTGAIIVFGLIALYFELSAPGIGAGGMIAALCAVLFFWSRFMGGTSGWLEVILFCAGLTFLLMEIFVIPGWGVSGITGIILLGISGVLASQNFVLPDSPQQWNQMLTSLLVMACSAVIVVIAAGVIAQRMGSIPGLNRMVLAPADDTEEVTSDGKKPVNNDHPLVSVGDWGTAESVLRPAGRGKFAGQSVDVVSDGSFIEPGDQIRVTTIEGNRIVVEPIPEKGSSAETVHRAT